MAEMINHKHVFRLHRSLTPEEAQELRAIPGVSVFKTNDAGYCPRNYADQLVEWLPGVRLENQPRRVACLHPSKNPEIKAGIWSDFAKPFQQSAVEWAIEQDGGIIWAAPGAGKTLMAILWYLSRPGPVVVVTRGGARRQWAEEVSRFTHAPAFAVMPESSRRKKDKTLEAYLEEVKRPVLIIGWEMLADVIDTLEAWKPESLSVVFDEIHMGKSQKRLRWYLGADEQLTSEAIKNTTMAAYRLAKLAKRRLGTTATPVANRLIDLWGQLSLVEPDCWGLTSTRFGFRYCEGKEGAYGGLDLTGMDETTLPELQRRLGHVTYQIDYATSHAELPPKRRNVIRVDVADQVKSTFKYAREAARIGKQSVSVDEEERAGASSRILELQLMDAASRVRSYALGRVRFYLQSADGHGKVVLFTGRRKECDELAAKVATMDVTSWAGHGEVSERERHEMVKAYMAHPGPCVLVGTMESFGESLNLMDTDALIWAMLPWTPKRIEQGEGRVDRLGQTRNPVIEYLVCMNTVAERIASRLLDKMPAVDAITGGSTALGGLFDSFKNKKAEAELIASFLADLPSADSEWGD